MSGILHHTPAEIIQQAIIDDGIGNQPPSTNWPAFINNNQKANTLNLTILDTTGFVRGKTQVDSEHQEAYGIQILVRHPNPPECYLKAQEIFSALSLWKRKIVDLEGDSYTIHAATFTSPILRVGKEQPEEALFVYSLNLTVTIRLLT